MEYTIEDMSPVKKKLVITVAPEEVNSAIDTTVAAYKKDIKLDGFRKGKVPAAVVEKKFHDAIYREAREDLLKSNLSEILEKTKLEPAGSMNLDGMDKALERNSPYGYSIDFEIFPAFDLPPYEGLEVEEKEVAVEDEMLDKLIDRLREREGKLITLEGTAPARDGQIAVVDIEGFEDDKSLPQLKETAYDLRLDENDTLPGLIPIVKGIPVGHTGEGQVTFPEDYLDEDLAGRTVTVKITVRAVKEYEVPPLNDKLAEKMGYENLAVLKDSVREDALKSMKDFARGEAQRTLLDGLLKLVDFELPPSVVNMQVRLLLTDMAARLEKKGKSIGSLGKSMDDLVAEVKPTAEKMAREEILLLAVAKKEGLEVSDREVSAHVFINCLHNGQDFRKTYAEMENSGMLSQLHYKMLQDKAMDLIYDKAAVKIVPSASSDNSEGEGRDENSEASAVAAE